MMRSKVSKGTKELKILKWLLADKTKAVGRRWAGMSGTIQIRGYFGGNFRPWGAV